MPAPKLVACMTTAALLLAGCKTLQPVAIRCPSPPNLPDACANLPASEPSRPEVQNYLREVETYLREWSGTEPSEPRLP